MLAEGVSPANLPIPQVRDELAVLPLSFAQERQWFLWQLDPQSTAYHMSVNLRLRGALDAQALQDSLDVLVARHDSLRTRILADQEQPVQVIDAQGRVLLERAALTLAEGDQDAQLRACAEAESARLFDLQAGPLLRVRLVTLGEQDHLLLLTQHHIVSDGRSMQVLVRELMHCYEAFSQGEQPLLAELPIQYADYAVWQRHWMEAGERQRQLGYWTEQLAGDQALLELPLDRPRSLARSGVGGRVQIELPGALAQAVRQLAQRSASTSFMVLLASFQALLHRYSGQADIRIGVANANRNRVETEGLIGFFVNTQVMKAEFDASSRFSEVLQQVRQAALDAQAHQDLPFEQLVEALQPERSLSHTPLFQVMFNHQSGSGAQQARETGRTGLAVELLDWDSQTAKFDLTLDTFEHEDGLTARLSYASDLFDQATVERLGRHWCNLLQAIVADPERQVAQLPLYDAAEQQALVAQMNPAPREFPVTTTLHGLIEAQAARTPQAIALSFEGQTLSYAALNQRANTLAHGLIARGVGPDVLVGLAMERGLDLLVGLLAILKAGGAYVPLDPSYPQDRLAYMIENSGLQLLLTDSALLAQLPVPTHVEALLLDQLTLADNPRDPQVAMSPDNLAYVIYTSGSTGKPKGTLLAHRNVLRLFEATEHWFGFDASDVWTLFHSFAFDFSVWEIFGALLYGGRLVVVPHYTSRSPEDFHALLCDEGVTVLNQTPSAFKSLMQVALASERRAQALRHVVFGGEALDVKSLRPWFERFGDQAPRLINMYGITETTVHVTYRPLTLADLEQVASSPIGEPIPDLSWYLLDPALNPVPKGCVGELYIGRAGLARGYLKRGDLSATRFVPDPFGEAGERLYRTGDLARLRADGVVEYVGRIDHQVKIRGFRIELGEIEAQLLACPQVSMAVVLPHGSGAAQQLVAYVVPAEPTAPAQAAALREQLKASLREHLPDYMVPAHMLFLDSLPLTGNGKLDRRALPAPDLSHNQQDYVAPRSVLEQRVAQIWQEVLKVERVGLDDNFFGLGGHSLLATQVVSRVRQGLQREVNLRSLFEHATLAAFCQALGDDLTRREPALLAQPREQRLPLSYAQERQWFLWQLQPQGSAYHIPLALRLRGALDEQALQRSFDALVARHEPLRTRFVEVQGQAQQVIDAAAALPIARERLRLEGDAQAQAEQIEACVAAEVLRPFDLQQGPLLRVRLVRLGADDHLLVLTQHHIVSDGWSMQVMVGELTRLYAAFSDGGAAQLPALPIQYADYALWQRQWMEAGERERQLAYWRAQLGAEQPVLELPMDHSRPAQQSYRGARLALPVPGTLLEQLKAQAREQGATLFMLLLASFQGLLHRYSGQADIRVGVPIANRNRLETEGLIGFFVNTQVLKAEFVQGQGFSDLLQQVRRVSLEAQAHQDLPFEQLVDALRPERSLSYNPLFQVMFNHQATAPAVPGTLASQVELEVLEVGGLSAQVDLKLDTLETPDGLLAQFSYATDLFEAASIERLAQHWLRLLEQVVADPALPLDQLALLDDAEREQIVEQWNATATEYPLDRSIQQLIEAQVDRTPQAEALVFGDTHLSYAQLDARANQLARHLMAQGVGPDVLVGIAAERSVEMVVGLLAILKAGGAYVPLDPEYPAERLSYMFEDSGIQLLLTQSHLQLPLPEGLTVLHLDTLALDDHDDSRPDVAVSPENLAYVIYTSGSTGKPKGAGNRHSALVNRLCWMQQAYGLDGSDTVLQKTPFSFDVSVWEFFWPLMTGARLAVAGPGDHRDPSRLVELINQHQVSTLHFVPSMLQVFLQDEQVASCTSLKRIVCSGEALQVDAQQGVFAKLPNAGLYNLYGPTEAAIDVTHWTCREEGRDTVPIGQPIANLATYVLDGNLEPVPVGVVGELYLGGEGLARGYHRRPSLTAERFVTSPFGDGARLYRTGDLASQRADGVIEYRGRIDHQVKIRGLRIELGEIEARLLEQAIVREAAVLAVPVNGSLQLVAYLVAGDEDSAALREVLKAQLPDYMVPTHFIYLPALPVSPNGKLERKALPAPDVSQHQQAYVAPRSELEQRIAQIWQEVLKVEQVGLHDNFFELGGDSIVSIQVVSRARQAGIRFTPKDLFEQQTVQQLAGVARVGEAALVIDQSPLQGETPLLPFQQVFFATDIPARHHWNQSILLKAGETLQAELLEQALQALVRHHDALRLSFVEQAEGWQARFLDLDAVQALWQREPLLGRATANDEHALQAIGDQAQRSLDLGQGSLVRGVLVDCAEGEQRLLLVIHHLAVDGVSWRILLEDLQRAYQALADGQAAVLPAKTSSVRQWAERLQGYARDERRQAELQFWQAQLQGLATALPLDRAGSLARRHARTVHTHLDPVVTRQLLQQAPAAYRTQVNDLLLSALARVIAGWTGNSAVLVQLEGHGREALFDDIDLVRSVGWFTSLYPARLDAHAEIGATIKQVKEQLRAIPDKGLGYSALRHLGDPASRAVLEALPEAGITFNYLGQFDAGGDEGQPALLTLCAGAKGDEQDLEAPLGNNLTLNGQVFDGVFSMAWTFSAEQFDDATVQALADAYGAQLQALVAHCLAPQHGGVTPSDFPLARLTQAQLDELPIAAAHIEDIYALAPMQRGMLFHTLYEAEGGDYLNQMSLAVEGLDPQRFRDAWQATLDEHEVLRSSFVWEGLDEPVQVVHKQLALPFQCLDWRGRDDQQAALEALAREELARGFELSAAPLLRVLLVQLDDARYQLIQTHHHILMDGWSHSQLMAEVLQRYNGNTLPARVGRYRDYIAWLQRQDAAKAEGFWRGQLALLEEPTRLVQAMANLRAKDAPNQGHGELVRLLDAQQTATLAGFARQQKVTVNTVVQAAWLLLLQRQTGQDAVAFGATVAGRSAEVRGAEQQVGLFINTLPVVAAPLPEQRVGQWLQQVQAQNLALREFEHTPLFEVQRWSGHGAESLFDTLMVFENYPVAEALEQEAPAGLSFSGIDNHEQTNYPLTLSVTLGASLHLHFSYAHAAFSAAMATQLANRLVNLLEAMQDDASAPLSELAWLDAEESRRLVHDWSTAAFDCPSDEPVHVLFEAQAARTPEAPALLFEDRQLSYRALNEQANQLARKLVEQGVGPDVLVGIAADRGLEMIVGLLAVLKAGGGYVPLDPSYPQDRLLCMIEDSRIALLLGHEAVVGRLAVPDSLPRLLLDQPQHWAQYATDNLVNRVHGEHLAYVMFTSGSTGRPKGVGISQRALTRHAFVSVGFFGLSAEDRGLQFSTFNFDGFVEQLYPPLICGASVVLRGNEIWDSETFYRELIDKDISVVDLTTAYWNMLAKDFAAQAPRAYGRLRQVHSGGEAMPVEGLAAWQAAGLGHVRLLNTYGPTEATVTVSTLDCSDYVNGREPLPLTLSIGRALPGRSLYLLDDHGQPAAVGVVGELMIGGELLARGYFGRPGLTAERFLPDPFAADGGRLYRTGDLVRYREDGLIDYIGRVDHQVKIRGFRIELGEIEARLVEHPQVHEAVVVARKAASGQQLVGYYVVRGQAQEADTAVVRESVREHLKALLPDYMVPAYLVALPRLPLSPNGKLDRKALPEVDASELQQAYEAPRNALQATLATIWQDVLQLERIGISDNFFELGGDSIVSIQVVSRARRAGIVFTPKQLFEQQTIAALAAVASHDDAAQQQGALSGALPALPAVAAGGAQWMHLSVPAALDRGQLEQALVALVGHHDSLRVRLAVEGSEYLPLEALQAAWQAQPLLIDDEPHAAQRQVLAQGLAPAAGILLRAALGREIEGRRPLLLVGAGEVLDSHSWALLGQDLQALCEQRALPAKTHSLRHWLAQRGASGHVQVPEAPALTALRETAAQPGAFSLDERLPANLGQPLLNLASAAYRSDVGELLLTALVLCLGADSEQSTIALAAQTGRRVAAGCDLARSVGPFASRQVLHLPAASDLASAIKAVKESVRGGQVGAQPLPAIAFSYAAGPAAQTNAWPVLGQGLVSAPAGLHLHVTQQGDRLHLHWTLEGRYQAEDLQRLAARYQAQLQGLVEHCLDPHNQGVTPSDFPLAALTQRDLDQLPVAAVDIEDIYPLSPMQEGMLFHSVSDDDGELYINQSSMSIDGLDVQRLREAWMFVTERHAVQRSSFHWQAGLSTPLQVVHRHVELDLRELDWRDAAADEQRLAELAREERERGFELSSAPLHRVLLVRLSEARHQMIWTSHHILMDGWSSSRLFAEVLQHYAGQALPEQVGHYRDFIAWLVNQDRDALEQFWRERLRPLEEPTLLSQAVHPRHEAALPGHQALYSHWDPARTAQLQQRCRDLRITLNTLVQAAWLLVLQRYTGQTTLAFGATVAGRPESLPGADSMLGLFINTLPVIQTLEPTQPLEQWLHALQSYNLDIRDYSQAPLADVQRWAGLGAQGLFDSIIVFENYPIDERLNEEIDTGLSFGASASQGLTNFPMDLAVSLSDRLTIEYMYLRSSFAAEAVEGIRACMEQTLDALLEAPAGLALGNLPRLTADQQQALQGWSAAPQASHQALDLPQLIARHAERQPQAIAVQCGEASLDYATLEQRANRLAHALQAQGAGPERVVGVAMQRSPELLVALLAVFKSGAAYVPLDIDYPPERLAYMIEDSGMSLLLTEQALRARFDLPATLAVLEVDRCDTHAYPTQAPSSGIREHSLAYLIYTSGSTGRPKGVAVAHGPISAHCQAIVELYEMDAHSRELHFMSFAFDGAHERWLSTLLAGGTLVLRDNELWTPEQTCAALHRHGITIACFPPAYLKQLAEFVQASAEPAPPVRIYCFGGDAVPEQTYEQVKAALKPRYFTNGYGPTETVVTPMLWKADSTERCAAAYAPIGRAVGPRALYVLDDDLRPLPAGFAGELYIGGYGVARGYHRRPDASAERFVPNPFSADGDRLYRTGDLVRLRADGIIDYVGRIDHQVKIRGFRIELGEIEARLRQQAQVDDALVIARESPSGKQLIGYVVSGAGEGLGNELKAALRQVLPEYMVPAQIVCLARFPLTPNGKIDRRGLPEPQFEAARYVAPRNPREQWLAQIWEDVLQVEQVGITDNFFELGGDSILSLQVISRVRNHPTLEMDLKLRDLMRHQSIEALFDQGAAQRRGPQQDLTQLAGEGLFNLIPIQQWFFDQQMEAPHHFNQSLMLRASQPLDGVALEKALLQVVRHHDSLRLRFRQENGRWYQYYDTLAGSCEWIWHRDVADAQALNELVNAAQRSLDLIDGPVIRVVHAQMADGESRLMIAIHHLVIDGVSWRILLQDLQQAYAAYAEGREATLPIRTSSFRSWAEALQGEAPNLAANELDYWLAQLDQPGTDLPCDNPRGRNEMQFEASAQIKLSERETARLLKEVPAVYQTQINDILLTALSRVLCRWSEAESVLLQFEGHGREDLFEALDLSRTLGWFTSMYPLRLQPGLGADFGSSIKAVRQQLAQVPNKGLGYGILRHMAAPEIAERFAGLPEARVTFNYMGQFDQTFEEDGLLSPASESSGAQFAPRAPMSNWLEVTGQVYDGQMSLLCFYSTRRYRATTVESLMEAFREELLHMIEHCLAHTTPA